MQGPVEMPCLGGINRHAELAMPERHLGLVTHEDHPISEEMIGELADIMEKSLDLDRMLQMLPEIDPAPPPAAEPANCESGVRIAVARDNAFCFYYPDNLDLLEQCGAEMVPFSPMTDDRLPQRINGLYFGGGYPELYAGKLSSNHLMREQIRSKSRAGMPVYGECGGFMYLCEELVDQNGNSYPMSGCFPFATQMQARLRALGYREVTLLRDTVIGNRGLIIRGHEFHYSELLRVTPEVQTVYRISDRAGLDKAPEGYQIDQTLGSYNHLHFGSQPEAARFFVENCRQYRNRINAGKESI
jgi:cobyrinic acid a,c-diamide synthase